MKTEQKVKILIACFSICGQCGSDDVQVVGDDAPADPSFEAFLAVVATAIQSMSSFRDTDPTFHTIVVVLKQICPLDQDRVVWHGLQVQPAGLT